MHERVKMDKELVELYPRVIHTIFFISCSIVLWMVNGSVNGKEVLLRTFSEIKPSVVGSYIDPLRILEPLFVRV